MLNHKVFIKSNKLIRKIEQRFTSDKHNVFTEEINNIALSSNDVKRMQSIDSINLLSEKGEIKYKKND